MKGLKRMIDMQLPLTKIEEAFADALEGRKELRSISKTIKVYIEMICKALCSNDDDDKDVGDPLHFSVEFVNGKDQFLGISVYPSIECISRLCNHICECNSRRKFNESWRRMNEYTIELDENLFERSIIAFNPQELTAMLLHEISHVAFSSKKAEKFFECYLANRDFIKLARDMSSANILASIFYAVPITTTCGMHEWAIGNDGMMRDWICDQVFGVKGYQEHMVSALNKIIRTYGNTVVISEDVQNHNIDVDVKWANLNIKDIVRRSAMTRSEIFYRASRTRSFTVRRAYLYIIAKLGVGLKDRYTDGIVAMEAVLADIDEGVRPFTSVLSDYKFTCTNMKKAAAIEGLSVRAFEDAPAPESIRQRRPPKLPSDYAIDEISIEIDRVENHYDRIYVLDLIYNRLAEIDIFENYYTEIGEIHKYAAKIKAKREYLEKLRQAVLEKKVLDKNYTVFVKCPKGYEG